MYVKHEDLRTENTSELPLWRYMDLWKFLKIINSSSLFFPSVGLLGDQMEGKIPELVYLGMKEHDKQNGRDDSFVDVFKNFMEDYSRNKTLVLSWNAAKTESFALWKMYAKDKLGVAIKTDLKSLKKCFNNTKEEIFIGEVSYFDENKPEYNIGQFSTLLTKHIYYNYEKEVRCLTRMKDDENLTFKNISVDLNELIREVYISPFAYESGLLEIIEFLREKHKLNFEIKMSGINDSWL
ncbi:DUF2971 domain-containing protein [Zunongwangia sp. HRR-M8]|uniref:DUF2971 domain-containing protein n=1 Tax=Zunongwangia sp. HRR-M8 TaxID=3015170 RepID=UPI0022DE6250|nr:DUF2971 domain-containing protein [Zunongwangia sp. HRR-M8]WBL23847.1 DUF2971 domain-containing protein [Zunongwangia sp. HRR-M8]